MDRHSRRDTLRMAGRLAVSAAGLAVLSGCGNCSATRSASRVDAPLETTTIRLAKTAPLCFAPQYVAEDLLRAKGFTDVRYVDVPPSAIDPAVVAGEIDMAMTAVGGAIIQADASDAQVMLAGIHVGCYELFANPTVRSITDLKGKTVAVSAERSGRHIHLAAIAAYVGLDLNRETRMVFDAPADAIRLLSIGQADAFIANPPEPQELRAKGIGHVVLNTAVDRPWSQYFCCMLTVNRAFLQKHPVATRRGLQAILEAADICANEPERAAQTVVDHGFTANSGYAVQSLKDVPYDRWREYDPEDTVRFYSLRLQEVGMIKSSPEQIIQRGTDWRHFNELKRELKA
jgi:NitT/TauT family transport system substrate-binding protein